MIGIVAVSHSAALAEAAVALALEMVPRDPPRVVVAAGAGADPDGTPITGTDATRVAAAIDELADTDGVLVLMDLGSAVLSAEMALEFAATDVPVRLCAAPFVEGLLAAVVRAAGGASLDEVAAEAEGALAPKRGQLADAGDSGADHAAADPDPGTPDAPPGDAVTRRVELPNPLGIHARPAALIATAAGGAGVRIRVLRTGTEASAASPTALLALGARHGDALELSAAPDAREALDRVAALVADGFGELDAAPSPPSRPAAAPRAAGPLGVSPGRAVAPVVHLAAGLLEPAPEPALPNDRRAVEAERITASAARVADALRARAAAAAGEARDILQATALMAADPGLLDTARASVLERGDSAARAVWEAAHALAGMLADLGGRTAERVADVRDVRDRIVADLLGLPVPGVPDRDEPFVLVARDLAPADTATLDPDRCVALVTEEGGPTSHTAILARALGIPAVVAAAGALGIAEGTPLLVDGTTGELTENPDPTVVAEVRAAEALPAFTGDARTADGHAVALLANVGGAADARAAADAGADGVGLFRTEFCFLDRAEAPTVDEQVSAYRAVLAAFPGRRVVVRTLDAGADKPLPFVTADHEENPALGVRGLRTSWRHPEVLGDQLAAIARVAAAEGSRVEVMAPMVATVDEARDFVAACRAAGIERAGVMIETPAAALSAAELMTVVDFVSIGTNDLTQYTLAADRQLGELAALNDPWQPAVLRLIGGVGAAGRTAGIPVGVCGEAAADPLLATVLVGLGVGSLSMSPRALAAVAARIADATLDRCRAAADAALAASTAHEARLRAADALR